MGIFDRFPYSSTHEMNLDFMLGKATEIAESLQEIDTHKDQAEQAATNAAQSAQSAAQAAQAAAGSQTAAGTSASQAAQHKADAEDAADRAEAASDLADEAVEQAQAAAQTAGTAAQNASTAADGAIASASAAETRINNLAASLPEDFTELNNEVTDLKSAISNVIKIDLTETSGYLAQNGTLPDAPSGNTQEVYSQKIAVKPGQKIQLELQYDSNAQMWICYGTWNSVGTFLGRVVLVSSVVVTNNRYTEIVTVPEGAAEILFSWRTWGYAHLIAEYAYNIHDQVNGIENETEKNTAAIEQISEYPSFGNVLEIANETKTSNGITFTSSNGVVTASGTASANAYIDIPFIPHKSGVYWLKGCAAGGASSKWYMYMPTYGSTENDTGDGCPYELTAGESYFVRIVINKNQTANSLVFTPVLTNHTADYTKQQANIGASLFRTNEQYDHLFIDTVGNTNAVIPCQSPFHVPISKKLGFSVIETNVQKTSDNKYVVMHGVNLAFGDGFYSLDSTDISNTLVSSVTLDYIKTNVRFWSSQEKYRVAPLTLEEWLHLVKRYALIPLVDVRFGEDEVTIVDGIMGQGNYIAYNGDRTLTSAPVMIYKSVSSVYGALFWCRKSGPNSMLCVANGSNLTDELLKSIVEAVHGEGYLIGAASSYETPANILRYEKLGFDFYASNCAVPYFSNGNIADFDCLFDYSSVSTTGEVQTGYIQLDSGETVIPAQTYQRVFVGAEQLEITFDGSITVTMGKINAVPITSDGDEVVRLSSYIINNYPAFTITASASTKIIDLSFKAKQV